MTHHTHHQTQHLYIVVFEIDGRHVIVGGLQAHTGFLDVKPLERDFLVVDLYHGGFTVLCGLEALDDDDVAIEDVAVDHRVAAHAQSVSVASHHARRHMDGLVVEAGLHGQTGGDYAQQGNLDEIGGVDLFPGGVR